MNTAESSLPEGEEPPPRGAKTMAYVRWVLIAALALLALWSVKTFWLTGQATSGAVGTAQTKTYVCPMHPKVQSDKPGTCPICGMDLVEKETSVAADVYVCPMHPQIKQDHAGSCPICGMDLVKQETSATTHGTHESLPELATVTLPGERVQRLGVRTVTAEVASLTETLRTVGVLTAAEGRNAVVQTRFSGWIEEVLVEQTGARVKKGDALVRIYSPEVLQAVEEYRTAQGKESEDPLILSLRKASTQRLSLLGVDASEVTASETGRPSVTLRAPRDGYVIQRTALSGMYVQPGTALYEIADLGVVWMLVEVREDALARIKVGQKAAVTFNALPGAPVTATLTYLYPAVDPATRTLKARLELPNPRQLLRPGMAATVEVLTAPARGVVVPADAVVHTGRNTYAFVQKAPGTFEPRALTLGTQVGDRVEIRAGVEAGEEVVVGALFLLDSESRLRAGLAPKAAAAPSSGVTPQQGGSHGAHAH